MSDVATPAAGATPSSTSNSAATPAPSAPSTKSTTAKAPASPSGRTGAASQLKGATDATSLPAEGTTTTTEQQQAKQKWKFKHKIDGQEIEREYDEDELNIRLQKGEAAEKRMQEAAELKKQIAAIREYVKQNPLEALKDPFFGGVDVRAQLEQEIAEKWKTSYAESQMTPEQRMQKEYEAKVQAAQKEAEEARKQLQAREQEQIDKRVYEETMSSFTAALKAMDVEASDEALYQMARIAKINRSHGVTLTPQQLAKEVQTALNGSRDKLHKAVVGGLKGQALLDHLGPQVVKEAIRAYLEKAKAPQVPKPPEPPKESPTEEPDRAKPKPGMSTAKFRRKHLFGL